MRSNYKQLGQYISEVNIKNTNLEVDLLLGVSITKKFIPSIANTIGTDMSKYKIVRKNQFGYGPITSRNGDKISVALLTEEQCIISTSYRVFEIKDHEELDPEYLMMWFRRPEFDRYARFMSHGSTRESFDWDEMCETELPVPYIENQREIVKEYNTIVNRIKLNKQLNQKLEETAQALYKHWFVDFEFPNEDGQPYKSSGGAMIYNKELDLEIPEKWIVNDYETSLDFKTGKLNSNAADVNGLYPFFTCSSETFKTNTFSFDTEALLLAGNNASAIYPFKYFKGKFDAYQRTYVITPKSEIVSIYQAYFAVLSELDGFKGTSSGTATKFLTMKILNPLRIIEGDIITTRRFKQNVAPMFSRILLISNTIEKLNSIKQLLLSKMSKVKSLETEQVL